MELEQDDIVKITSKRLVAVREREQLSQSEMALRLSVDQANYSRYEREARDMPIKVVYALAAEFGINLNWLFGLSDIMYAREGRMFHKENLRIKIAADGEPVIDIEDINLKVAENMKLIRAEAGKVKQIDLAKIIDMYQSNYSMVEKGVRKIKLLGLYSMSATYGININWMFGLSDIMNMKEAIEFHNKNILSMDKRVRI